MNSLHLKPLRIADAGEEVPEREPQGLTEAVVIDQRQTLASTWGRYSYTDIPIPHRKIFRIPFTGEIIKSPIRQLGNR